MYLCIYLSVYQPTYQYINFYIYLDPAGPVSVPAVPRPLRLRGWQRRRAHLRGGRRHRHPGRDDGGRQLDGGRPGDGAGQARPLPGLVCPHDCRLMPTQPAHALHGVVGGTACAVIVRCPTVWAVIDFRKRKSPVFKTINYLKNKMNKNKITNTTNIYTHPINQSA